MSKDKLMAFMKTFFRILLYIVLFACVFTGLYFRWMDIEQFRWVNIGKTAFHTAQFVSEVALGASAVILIMNIGRLKRVRWFRNTMIAVVAVAALCWASAPYMEHLYSKHKAERLYELLDKYSLLHEGNSFSMEEIGTYKLRILDPEYDEMNEIYHYLLFRGEQSIVEESCMDCCWQDCNDGVAYEKNIDGSPIIW